MTRATVGLRALLAYVLSLALSACQANLLGSPSAASPATALQRLALCDGENVWQYDVSADDAPQKTLLLKLPPEAHCPQWSPLTRDALLSIQTSNDDRAMADTRSARQLRWFNGHTQSIEDFTLLLSTDVSYEPVWQREGKPMLAITSARDVENECGALTAMYAAASSSVPGPDAVSRSALIAAQNALRGGSTSVAISAQVMCRTVKPEPFLITPDGAVMQLAALSDPICELSLASGGMWLFAITGICRKASFGRKLNLMRIDTGQIIAVPLDSAVHGIQQVLWEPARLNPQGAPGMIVTALRLTGSGPKKQSVLDVFWVSPEAGTPHLQMLVSGLTSLDLVQWLADDSVLLVHDRALYRMHLTDVAPVLVARLPALAERCVSQFAVSVDERFILQHDSCDGLIGQLVWIELSTGKLGRVEFSHTAAGHSVFSNNSTWIATEALERYQFTIRSRIFLIRMRDGKMIDLGFQRSATQLDWLQE